MMKTWICWYKPGFSKEGQKFARGQKVKNFCDELILDFLELPKKSKKKKIKGLSRIYK